MQGLKPQPNKEWQLSMLGLSATNEALSIFAGE
jgi:hypothetical protein